MAGMKAGPFDWNAIELAKFKEGKLTEHWTFMQPADMAKMMASMTPQQPMTDTTRK